MTTEKDGKEKEKRERGGGGGAKPVLETYLGFLWKRSSWSDFLGLRLSCNHPTNQFCHIQKDGRLVTTATAKTGDEYDRNKP